MGKNTNSLRVLPDVIEDINILHMCVWEGACGGGQQGSEKVKEERK